MKFDLEKIRNSIPKFVDITLDRVEYVASLPAWSSFEAICYALGKCPVDAKTHVPTGTPFVSLPQTDLLMEHLDRALIAGLLKHIPHTKTGKLGQIKIEVNGHYFEPLPFMEWLHNNPTLPCDKRLYKAVMLHHQEVAQRKAAFTEDMNGKTPEIQVPTEIDQELWSHAERIIEKDRLEALENATGRRKNAMQGGHGKRQVKIKGAYYALWYIRQGCTCINRPLADMIFQEMYGLVQASSGSSWEKGYIEEGVKMAFYAEESSKSRVYKGRGWDKSWLDKKCDLHGTVGLDPNHIPHLR